jgi:hypothetical protein
MKVTVYPLQKSNGRHLPLVLVILLLASVGLAARVAVDRIERAQEEMASALGVPSQVFVWKFSRYLTTNATMSPRPQKPTVETNRPPEPSLTPTGMQ